MKMSGGGKSVRAAKMACSFESADERIFKSVKMVHPGIAGINAGQFLAAVSDNLKARMSDANVHLITCLKVLEPTIAGQTMTAVSFMVRK